MLLAPAQKSSLAFLLTLHSRNNKSYTPDQTASSSALASRALQNSLLCSPRRTLFPISYHPKQLASLLLKMFPSVRPSNEHDVHPDSSATGSRNSLDSTSDNSITIPHHHATLADLDDSIHKVISALSLVREEMTVMVDQHPVSTDDLADLVEEARSTAKGMMFTVKRYYHDKEEGLRTAREREYAALEEKNLGCVANRFRHALITVRYDLGSRASVMAASRDSRTRKLQDALDKVEMHRILVALADGGNDSY